jgi:1,4-dihydroxy-2-naphthoate octaprenyltransferase
MWKVSPVNKDKIIKIIKLGRLHFVGGGFLLFCLGVLSAIVTGAEFSFSKFVLGYAILFSAHLSVSYSNDYFDYEIDISSKPTVFTGGSGILIESPELRIFAKRFALFLIFLSLILAIFFTLLFSFPLIFLAFVVFGNLLGWFYTAPPIKLVYRKLGELATVLTAGIMLPGMGYFVMKSGFDMSFLILAIPLMLYGMVFILGVEIPDMECDIKGNKRTLIVRKGRSFGFTVMGLGFLLATIYFAIMALFFPSVTSIRFEWLAFFSIIPTSLGLIGLKKRPIEKLAASKFANNEVVALFLFVILFDVYLLFIVI